MNIGVPPAFGPPLLSARMRVQPEDFFVEEIAGFAPSGQGEHLLLVVEKRGMNTAFAAKRIAAWAGVPESAIGYAGLKDRHAVTRQRFTVHLPKRVAPDLDALQSDDPGSGQALRVLSVDWHARKLPRGALAGNRFAIVLRDVAGERTAIDARLQDIARRGLPNAFGEQRFGRHGDNLAAARQLFAGRRFGREQRSFYLSAARAELFNAVLARRVADDSWDTGLDGEVWMLDGSHSVFGPEPRTDVLRERAARFDIHPTGPLWGRGELRSDGLAGELERQVLAPFDDLRDGLAAAGLRQERRALRVRVEALAWEWPAADRLSLTFGLSAGSYATALLAQLGPVIAADDRSSGTQHMAHPPR